MSDAETPLKAVDMLQIAKRFGKIFANDHIDLTVRGGGMVHQHFMLIPPFTVTQNIILITHKLAEIRQAGCLVLRAQGAMLACLVFGGAQALAIFVGGTPLHVPQEFLSMFPSLEQRQTWADFP